MVTPDAHPLLDLLVLSATWPAPLGEVPDADWLRPYGDLDADTPFQGVDDVHKKHVRDLLRHGGFKPAGRSKPCWEYLRGMTAKGFFPWINPAVDVTNVVAMHGALPVSTVDADKVIEPLRVGIAEVGSSYVFNPSGQTIDLSGLLCLFDAQGPCANAVKDAQRSKTDGGTTRTLTLVWGTRALPGRAEQVANWQEALMVRLGATVTRGRL
jgi:DNA/RNA-binding domain of Phe-tRNA-synthetase-like protein